MQLTSLRIAGYRSVRDLSIEPAQLTVIVGANGVGKTNLYRALVLLQAAAEGRFARALAEEGGTRSVMWAGRRLKGPVRMTLTARLEELEFELSCGPVPPVPMEPQYFVLDPEVKEETGWVRDGGARHVVLERKDRSAFVRDGDGRRVTFPAVLTTSESVLSQLAEPHRFPLLSSLRTQLLSWRFYHHFPTGPDAALRQPQVATRTPVLSADGRDLAAALVTIELIGDGGLLERSISAAFPGAQLDIPVEERLRVRLTQPGLNRPMEATELSDGTLRYLCLLAALLSPRPPPLLALNEPETSLHPELLPALADAIIETSRRSQVLVTTHDELLTTRLAAAKGARVMRLVRDGGETREAKD